MFLGNLYVVVGEVGKRMDLNDNDRLGFREEFSDNVYVPIEDCLGKGVRLLLSRL